MSAGRHRAAGLGRAAQGCSAQQGGRVAELLGRTLKAIRSLHHKLATKDKMKTIEAI